MFALIEHTLNNPFAQASIIFFLGYTLGLWVIPALQKNQ